PEVLERGAQLADQGDNGLSAQVAARAPAGHQAPAAATRPRYSPVRVSTLTMSPSLRNSGTSTTAPVSSVAGFVPPCAVSPRTPGSVLATASSTFSPERNVLSITFPSLMCLSLVRTNAPPFPGLTCWNSTIVYGWPSKTMRNPFLNSAVDTCIAL